MSSIGRIGLGDFAKDSGCGHFFLSIPQVALHPKLVFWAIGRPIFDRVAKDCVA